MNVTGFIAIAVLAITIAAIFYFSKSKKKPNLPRSSSTGTNPKGPKTDRYDEN